MTVVAGTSVPPGTYTLTVIGTSGIFQHQASMTLTVTTPPTPRKNSSGFAFTNNPRTESKEIAFDNTHNLIFASNYQLSEVEVISPQTLRVTKRIPVPSPIGIDLSPDGSILYVGSASQNFYEISTSLLQVVKAVAVPPDLGLYAARS